MNKQFTHIIERAETGKYDSISDNSEEREVFNSNLLLQFIREHSHENADCHISEELIRKLHYITTEGCNYSDNIHGRYRHHSPYNERAH